MLGIRLLTGLTGFPILLLGILNLSEIYFGIFVLFILVICVFECSKMFLSLEGFFEKFSFPLLEFCVGFVIYFDFKHFYVLVFIFLSYFLFRNLAIDRPGTTVGRKTIQRNFQNLGLIILFSLYLGIPFAMFMKVRELPFGDKWFVIILGIAWGGDVGGYFVGRFLKKFVPLKLFPIILDFWELIFLSKLSRKT